MQKAIKLFVLSILFFFGSCATHHKQISTTVNQTPANNDKEISHTFYLVGDAGDTAFGDSTDALLSLKKRLENVDDNGTVIFLGDNIYSNGMPKKDDSSYNLAKHRLQVQIDAVSNFNGNRIFIPGNHDWKNNGIKGS